MKSRALSLILIISFSFPIYSSWSEGLNQDNRAITVRGRETALLTKNDVTLSDLAEVVSARNEDDYAVIALRNISITQSPAPGNSKTINASDVLQRLKAEGVNLSELRYTFPRTIKVSRASRDISIDEVRAAIEKYLSESGKDIAIREVKYGTPARITPGESMVQVTSSAIGKPGYNIFWLEANGEGTDKVEFKVEVSVDEWGEVPVAKRSLAKGTLVRDDDVMMARLNLRTLPRDAVTRDQDVIGLEISNNISYGEVFRTDKLAIPPVIKAGAKVTMMYKTPLFTATATGIALESGIKGQQLKIRNDSSKNIVVGTVIEPGLVGVNQ